MGPIDLIVFFGYLIGILTFGLTFAKRTVSREEFLVAGRGMGWIPIGLSVMVTVFSAVNYTAFTGEVAAHGLYVLMVLPVFVTGTNAIFTTFCCNP